MSELEFTLKRTELVKAFKTQTHNARAVVKVPCTELSADEVAQYDRNVVFHARRGELGWGKVLCNMNVKGKIVEHKYRVRIVSVIKKEKEYLVEIKFDDRDLF